MANAYRIADNGAFYAEYVALFGGESLGEAGFSRLASEAEMTLRSAATGVDGVCRLDDLDTDTDPDAGAAISRCICELVRALARIEGNAGIAGSTAYTGVASVSAGGERIAFRAPGSGDAFARAAADPSARGRLLYGIATAVLRDLRTRGGLPLIAAV